MRSNTTKQYLGNVDNCIATAGDGDDGDGGGGGVSWYWCVIC